MSFKDIPDAVTVTPSDTVDLPFYCVGLTCTTAGTCKVTTRKGRIVTIYLNAGAPFPIRVNRVFNTGTTAAGIVGLTSDY